MKITPVLKTLLLVLFLSALTLACQEESVVIIEPPVEDAFTASSQIAEAVGKVTLRDGSNDNILSKGSCLSFELPVTVIVNGQELVITSDDDLGLVEYIIDEFDDDDDDIIITFPVTIILADYTRIEITSADELESYIDECEEGGIDDDIECVDFKYPIEIATYDRDNQVSGVVTIANDEELFLYLKEQDDDILMSFVFPLTLIYPDGSELTVNGNDELEEAIDDAEDSCDEDDDNDYDDDDVDPTEFRSTLIDGDWVISSFVDEGDDETAEYANWVFSFKPDGKVVASRDNSEVNGEWITSGDDGIIEIEFFFSEESPLADISEDWDVLNYSTNRIDLTDDGEESLVFEKI